MSTHLDLRTGAEAATVLASMAVMLVVAGIVLGFLLAGWGLPPGSPALPAPQPTPLPTASFQPEAGR
ncbi:MAG: hypothetical protein LCH76_03940 [Actinobacteria bacterium]|nr:hypothetical protein [Actinomycetota bacterium]